MMANLIQKDLVLLAPFDGPFKIWELNLNAV
jgi:hypothetical protein